MNLAFPAVLLLLLILPGYQFRRAFFLYRGGESLDATTLPAQILLSFMPAAVIHVVAVIIVHGVTSWRVRVDTVLTLLNAPDSLTPRESALISTHPLAISTYFLGTTAAGYVLGRLARSVIQKFRLDLRFEFLRYKNRWFYLFMGEEVFIDPIIRSNAIERQFKQTARELVQFKTEQAERTKRKRPPLPSPREKLLLYKRLRALIQAGRRNPQKTKRSLLKEKRPQVTFLTAVVQQGDELLLYEGIYSDAEFDKKGELDRIVLAQARRRPLADSKKPFYEIESDAFVIAYKDIHTLNVRYESWQLSDRWDDC